MPSSANAVKVNGSAAFSVRDARSTPGLPSHTGTWVSSSRISASTVEP